VKRKYINTKRINNTITQRTRRNDEISRENLKIGKAINKLENRKRSHYGGLEYVGSGGKLSNNNSI
jgi:cell division protein FtsB